jgi:hypothetical protein
MQSCSSKRVEMNRRIDLNPKSPSIIRVGQSLPVLTRMPSAVYKQFLVEYREQNSIDTLPFVSCTNRGT